MAYKNSVRERLLGTGSAKTEEAKSHQTSGHSTAVRDRLLGQTGTQAVTVDDAYINSFIADANKYFESAQADLDKIGYSTSDSIYQSRKDTVNDLFSRRNAISTYLEQNKDSIDQESYDSFSQYLSDFDMSARQSLDSFEKAWKGYNQFATEDDYDRAVREYGWYEQYQGQTSKELLQALGGLEKDSEEYSWLESYAAATDTQEKLSFDTGAESKALEELVREQKEFNELEDWYNEVQATMTVMPENDREFDRQMARYEELAQKYGTAAQLQSQIDQRKLYLSQAQDVQFALSPGGYDAQTDWQDGEEGWMEYVAQMQKQQELQQQADAKKSKWDTWAEDYNRAYNRTGDIGTMMGQVIADTQQYYREDTSYKEPQDNWTEEQKNAFGYLWQSDPAQAEKYAIQVNNLINAQERAEEMEAASKNAGSGFWKGAGSTLGAIAANIAFGIPEFVDNLVEYSARGDITQKNYMMPLDWASAAQSGVAQSLNEKYGTIDEDVFAIGGKGLGDLYNIGVSGLQSLAATALTGGGPAMLATFMGIGGANAVDDALSRGATGEQAIVYGLINGAVEGLTEMIPADELLKLDAVGWKKFLLGVLNQSLGESVEEGVSSVVEKISDRLVMGEKSNYNRAVQEYTNAGLSPEEAQKKAIMDMVGEVSFDALGGFLSGGGNAMAVGAGQNVRNQVKTAKVGNQIMDIEGGVNKLTGLASDLYAGADSQTQTKLSKQMEKIGEKANARNVGKLYSTVSQAVTEQNQADIAKSLTRKGIDSQTASTMAQVIADKMNGVEGAEDLFSDIIRDKRVQTVVSDLIDNYEHTVNQRNRQLQGVWSQETAQTEQSQIQTAKTEAKAKETAGEKTVSEVSYEVSADGKAIDTRTGKTVELQGLVDAEDGTRKIAVQDAQAASSGEISYASEGQAILYETFLNLENTHSKNKAVSAMSTENRNTVMGLYDPAVNKDANVFTLGAIAAYFYGYRGAEIPASSHARSLTKKQQETIWNLGKQAGTEAADADQKRVDAAYTKAQGILEQTGKAKAGEYHAVLDDGITPMSMSESQKVSYELADKVAQAAQGNIRVYAGKEGEFGYYDHDNDQICLNLNAQNKSRVSMMAFTLGHELVHRAKQGSPKKYKAFADFLLREYGKQGVTIEELAAEQIAAAKRHNVELSDDKALEEVICDACQRMLLDTDAGQKLAEFGAESTQNMGFLEELKRWISQFMDKLRKVFQGVDPDSKAAKEFAKFDKTVQQTLADMFVDMTMDAGEKLSTIKAAYGDLSAMLYEGQVMYSLPKVETIKPSEERIEQNIVDVANMDSVYSVNASKLSDSGKPIAEVYREFFEDWGENIHSEVFGDIAAKNSSIRSEFRHGSTSAKIASIEAIPSVIKSGKIVGWIEKNNGTLFRIVVAAPITIGENPYIMGVMLQRDNQFQRLYLHDVVIEKEASNFSQDYLVSTGSSEKRENLFTTSILQKVLNVKRQSRLDKDHKLSTGEDTSPRALLANALASVTQNDSESHWIKEYREKIGQLNEQEQKLHELRAQIKELSFAKGKRDTDKIKELQFEAIKTENRISILDRQMLRLEAAKPLQDLLNREKAKAKKRAEQKAKADMEAYRKAERERDEKREKEIRERYQESRKKATEGRHKTEMRHKIQKVVKKLNDLLLKETKDKHVPEGLKKAVAGILDAVNMEVTSEEDRRTRYEATLERYERNISLETNPEKRQMLEEARDAYKAKGDQFKAKMDALKEAYNEIKNDNDPLMANVYDDGLASHIMTLTVEVGDTPLREMSMHQLECVYDVLQIVMTTIQNANKAFKTAKNESISVMGKRVMEEVRRAGRKKNYQLKGMEGIASFDWNNLKPIYAFERIGSETLTQIYENVRSGEDIWAKDVSEAKEYFQQEAKKHHADKWDRKKRYRFTSGSGMDFELSLDQIMSLYAYSKREQAAEHLRKGGIVIDESTEVTIKTKLGIKMKFNPTEATAYNISNETLLQIVGTLTEEQKAFADEMQEYLSSVMGEKGNEVSLALYGIKLFKEKNYFPLKSASQFMESAKEQQEQTGKIKNKGFTKETKKKASNPIVLTPFMDVWADHVNEMSMYHAFVLPMEDFYRVWNYRTAASETAAPESVEMFVQNAYGKAATKYIEQLMKDLNGGARSDPRENVPKKLVSNFKKAAVMSSLSVIVQQPTAIIRAMAVVDGRNFGIMPITRGLVRTVNAKKHRQMWAEVKQYAPVAIIKEMGHFDTDMGRSTRDYIQAEEYKGLATVKGFFTDSGYRDEVISRPAALADELAWISIWEAVKKETSATHKELQVGSAEFMQVVGKRFTEVITRTQVYDSVLSRSANMRSKSLFMNMWTSFMAEPTTSINMLQDALLQAKRGKKRYAAKAIGAVYGSVILNAALVSIVYAMRDDDEDETFTEKYLARLATEVLDGMNPLTYIPFLKDVWSIMQGFAIERADVSLITDLVNSMQKTVSVLAKDTAGMDEEELAAYQKQVQEALWSIVDSISSLAGQPVKNARRDIDSVMNLFQTLIQDKNGRKTTANSLLDNILEDVRASMPVVGWLPGKSKTDKLYEATVSGDTDYVERLKSGYADESAYESALQKALRENDPRIKAAAQARYSGDWAEYERIFGEIEAEGHFTRSQIGRAVKAAVDAMDESESSSSAKNYGMYSNEDYMLAIFNGETEAAQGIREELVRTAQENGKTEEDAEKSLETATRSSVKEWLASGDVTAEQAVQLLTEFCGNTKAEAQEKVSQWAFEQEYGFSYSDRADAYKNGQISASQLKQALMDAGGKTASEADWQIKVYDWQKEGYDISSSSKEVVEDFETYCEPAGIEKRVYYDAYLFYTEAGEEGVAYSKTKECIPYIDELPLTDAQKTALALCWWSEKTVDKYKTW